MATAPATGPSRRHPHVPVLAPPEGGDAPFRPPPPPWGRGQAGGARAEGQARTEPGRPTPAHQPRVVHAGGPGGVPREKHRGPPRNWPAANEHENPPRGSGGPSPGRHRGRRPSEPGQQTPARHSERAARGVRGVVPPGKHCGPPRNWPAANEHENPPPTRAQDLPPADTAGGGPTERGQQTTARHSEWATRGVRGVVPPGKHCGPTRNWRTPMSAQTCLGWGTRTRT
jgi:hypothetical protein